jgi:hypothetical protein
MRMKSPLATFLATVAIAGAGTVQAAPVTIEQSMTLTNPSGGLVYSIATAGEADVPTTSYYQLIVDASWDEPTKFTTFSTEPVGSTASYSLWKDTNALLHASDTGSLLTSWSQTDIAANNTLPFFSYMMAAGQYVLGITTLAGQHSISTNISAVPLPGAVWLFGTALAAFLGISRRRKL